MTQQTTPFKLTDIAQKGIMEFHRQCYNMLNQQWNLRETMREIDLQYAREKDWTKENLRAKAANRYGDTNRYQNVTIPVVMPQVESAVEYQTSVFLTGEPLFGVVASPQYEDQAMMLETLIDENATRGAWKRELMMTFRDGFKYNLCATEVSWGRKVTAALEQDPTFMSGKQAKPKEVIWEGNVLRRLDMYNTFFDARVDPTKIHEQGEFAGWTEVMSRIALKKFIAELPDKMVDNIKSAFESGLGTIPLAGVGNIQSYYIPDINRSAILEKNIRGGIDWLAWAGVSGADKTGAIQYKNVYEVTTLYARILPSDFGIRVPAANTPQVWKFVIVNHQVLIYAERLTNAHGFIPILFSQPYEDGLTYQTKSLAQNAQPFQEIGSAMMNSVLAARRRAISDRGLYDPSRVTEANINSANPSAKIPVKPAAYGKPLNEAYYPIPFNDTESPILMQQIGVITGMANQTSGQNPARQGQFVKGNKTLHEYQDVMSHANGRDQMTSILLEDQLFTPMKQILKANTIQYQGGVTVFNRQQQQDVTVDPVALRKAIIEFKVSDGLTPADKLANTDVMMVAMQQIGSSQQIAGAYNVGPLFSYIMKLSGAKDLSYFEKSPEQQAYEQAVSQWQQLILQMQKQTPDITPDKFPPQPLPEQYKYDPSAQSSNQRPPSQ